MVPAARMPSLSTLLFFFSSVNFFFLQRKLFFQVPLLLGQAWAPLFFRLGIISAWEPVFTVKGKSHLKFFLRYKNLQPLGFFYWYSANFKHGQIISLAALRYFCSKRPGVTFLISTSRGLLSASDCLRLRMGGILAGIFI